MKRKGIVLVVIMTMTMAAVGTWRKGAWASEESGRPAQKKEQASGGKTAPSSTVVPASKENHRFGNSKIVDAPAFPHNQEVYKNFENTQRGVSDHFRLEREKIATHLPQVAHISARTGKNENPGYSPPDEGKVPAPTGGKGQSNAGK